MFGQHKDVVVNNVVQLINITKGLNVDVGDAVCWMTVMGRCLGRLLGC